MSRYLLAEAAKEDLRQAALYLAPRSFYAAERFAANMRHAFEFVAEWPALGHTRKDLTQVQSVRFWSESGRLVVYLSDRSPVLIVAVLSPAQDLQTILSSRLEQI